QIMIYTTGTVSTVSGSAVVSGTGTIILIKNGNANFIYMVDRVNSDTELVISQPATFTVKNTSYSINLTEPNSYSDANNRMTAIASDTTYFLRAMDQWMMNNGVVTVELSNGQKVTLDSIKKMQGDINNKADLTATSEQSFKSVINASRFNARQNEYSYMMGVRAGQAFLDYWDGKRWTGEVLHPQRPGIMMLVNDYGMNVSGNIWSADFNNLKKFGWFNQAETAGAASSLNHPTKRAGNLTVWRGAGQSSCIQHWMDYYTAEALSRTYYSYEDKWSRWYKTYGEQNTTVDPQGFIKKASPIVNINPDGTFTTNDESEGATVTRLAQGEYLIEGVLGFNSDAGWGGVDGGIEIPLDVNKQPLIWVDSKVMEDGSILVRTYHRTHPNAPKFARNDIDGYKDGDPIDIPDGRFISVRVQMTEQSIYNVRMREMEEAQKAEEERRQKEEEENQDTNKTPEIDN
ncbi:hypothetical protein JEP79_08610, partial [Proteus mirabilis]|nr:hypothetical protein [Proteus mirabilis]